MMGKKGLESRFLKKKKFVSFTFIPISIVHTIALSKIKQEKQDFEQHEDSNLPEKKQKQLQNLERQQARLEEEFRIKREKLTQKNLDSNARGIEDQDETLLRLSRDL